MAIMKIGHDSELSDTAAAYSDSDLFSFPDNPLSVKRSLTTQRVPKVIPHGKVHFLIDQGGLFPAGIGILGRFRDKNSVTKETYLTNLSTHVYSSGATYGLQRFYDRDDSFFFCFGANLDDDDQAGRSQFINYSFNLMCPIPFRYADAVRTDLATAVNSSTEVAITGLRNDGNAQGYILKYVITNSGNDITKVEIGDGATLVTSDNVITITGLGTDLGNGDKMYIYLFKVVEDNGINTLKQLYWAIGTTEANAVNVGNRDLDGGNVPFIPGGETNHTFSVRLTGASSSIIDMYWRDTFFK